MKKLMEYKWKAIISSLVTLLPVLTCLLLTGRLLISSLVIFAGHIVCLLAVLGDKGNREQSGKALNLAFWIAPITSLISGTIFYLAWSGAGASATVPVVVYFGMGIIFVAFGNYLPKVRRNSTVGIRVKWTFEDEENWNATHRFGGKVWVGSGLLCLMCGLIADQEISIVVFLLAVLGAAAAPILYSYLFYRKQLASGQVEKMRKSPKAAVVTAAITLAIVAFVLWVLFSGGMEVKYGDTSFTIDASGWSDLTVNYSDIEEIVYEELDPSNDVSDIRTGGFGNFRMSMGAFENELYGGYTRYTHASCEACVVLTLGSGTLVINGPDEEDTREIYEELLYRTGISG